VNGLTISRSTFDTTTGTSPGALLDNSHNFYGLNVTNLTVQNGTVFDGGSSEIVNIQNVKIDNLLGTSTFKNSIIRDGHDINLLITNSAATSYAGTADSITIEDNMRLQTPSPGSAAPSDNAQIRAEGGANMSVTVKGGGNGNSQFTGGHQNSIQLVSEGSVNPGKMTANISAATISGANGPPINLNTANAGTMTAIVNGLTLSSALSTPVNMTNFDTSTLNATITNNIINVPTLAGNGITASVENNGTLTTKIANNTITGNPTYCIRGQAKANGAHLNATVNNNTVTLSSASSLEGIAFDAGSSAGANTAAVCLNMFSNNSTSTPASQEGYRLFIRASTTFQLQNFVGNGTSATDVATWVNTTKSNTGSAQASITAGTSFTTIASCPVVP